MLGRPRVVAAIAAAVIMSAPLLAPAQITVDAAAGSTGSAASLPVVDAAATEASTTEPISSDAVRLISPSLVNNQTTRSAEPPVASLASSETVVLATWNGGSLTNRQVMEIIPLRKPKRAALLEAKDIPRLPATQIREIVRDLAFEQILLGLAVKAGITTETPEVQNSLKAYREQVSNRIYYEKVLEPRIIEADEKSAREYYDQNKEKLYMKPERFRVREIFLPFLLPHVVKAGETLDQIAERIAGSAAAADGILRYDELKYFRKPPPDIRNEVPFEPVREGEALLVPVSKAEETSRTRLVESLRERAEKGEDFGTLARTHGQAPVADQSAAYEVNFEGMIPALARAIKETSAGKVSRVVRSNYGVHLFEVTEYTPPTVEPFEEARKYIELGAEERAANASKVKRSVFDELAERHGLKLNTEALSRPDYRGDNPLVGTSALAEAPGFTYTLDMFQQDVLTTMKNWTSMTAEERANLVKSSNAVTRYLVDKETHAQGLTTSAEANRELESRAVIEITGRYLTQLQRKQLDPTEGQLREHYNAHRDKFTSAPQVTVREITKRIDLGLPDEQKHAKMAAARDALNRIKAEIKTLADFEAQARRESQNIATRSRGGLVGTHPIGFRGELFKNQVSQLKPGEVSEPFLYGADMMIIRLDSMTEATVAPFDQVMGAVANDYRRQMMRDFESTIRDKTLKEAGFELKF